jgi:hypothetical protein
MRANGPELPKQIYVFTPRGLLTSDDEVERASLYEEHGLFVVRSSFNVPTLAGHNLTEQIINFRVGVNEKQLLPLNYR